jgi:glucuronate isomerase
MGNDVFITDEFLLRTSTARRLYHEYAEDMPIVDYHCHLPPRQVAEDTRFENLTRIWLNGDHYKWRQMRTNGVEERYCTGDAGDWEKFLAWATTVPRTVRNPLYHWTHLELGRPFGITDRLLGPDTAESIWSECNAMLADPSFSARGIMKRMNVALVCTTDDPTDTLEHHKAIAEDPDFAIQVLPTFRPDKGMVVENVAAFNSWVDALAAAADVDIGSYGNFIEAIRKRHDYFDAMGCRLSDHGIETAYAEEYTSARIEKIFAKARAGHRPDEGEVVMFKSAMLYECGLMDHEKGWTQQLHLGALRNNNSRMFEALGPDTGFDSIGDFAIARPLSRLLDRLDSTDQLAKTILYNLNPRDNALMATMIGNFQDGSVAGKMQYGAAWWFLDQLTGMRDQIDALSNLGLLSRFVGMLTDSRSFLSYPRHEYFRRLLCDILGADVEDGLIPADMELVGGMVRDICYHNAVEYLGFDLPSR